MILSITVIALLVFLATRELVSFSESGTAKRLVSFLAIPIIPLLVLFVLTIVLRITAILD